MGVASSCACAMKLARGCPSKRNRMEPAFTLERLPWAASTWYALPASARIVPTRKWPSSSNRTCFVMGVPISGSRPLDQVGDVLGKARKRVVPALHHALQRARIEGGRLAVVEHLVAGLRDEPVALGTGDARHVQRGQLLHVIHRELEALARVQVALRPQVTREVAVRVHGGVEQRRAAAEALGQ